MEETLVRIERQSFSEETKLPDFFDVFACCPSFTFNTPGIIPDDIEFLLILRRKSQYLRDSTLISFEPFGTTGLHIRMTRIL